MRNEGKIINELEKLAAARGATVTVHNNGTHYQIHGQLLVNYYPLSRSQTAYVAGTTGGKRNATPAQAVDMAFRAPPVAPTEKKDTRSKNSRRIRIALIRRSGPFCRWCNARITVFTSTVEHVIPLHRGGLDNANNRVLACKPCNESRGHDMPELAAQETRQTNDSLDPS